MMELLQLLSFGPDGWGPALLTAACVTVVVAVCGFLLGGVIGAVIAWGKLAGGLPVRFFADVYTTVLRGIPDLLVVYLFYFGGSMAVTGIFNLWGQEGFVGVPPFIAGAAAIGVVSGAYQAEVFRGAFRVLAKGEIEAGKSVGMNPSAPVSPHYRAAGVSPRAAGHRQRLADGAEGIGADFGDGPGRASSPGPDRGRIDPKAVRILSHRRGDFPGYHMAVAAGFFMA